MLSKIKKSPIVRWIYKMPFLIRGYHLVLAFLGSFFYAKPSKKIKVIGITGTKGKTSSLEIVNSIFEAAGEKTALLSSVRVKIGDKSKRNVTENSMPGRMYIQRFLRRAVREKCAYAFVEATSQGAVMYRHAFIKWAAAAITNLHPEHIESHGSYEKYRQAKLSFLAYAGHDGSPVFVNEEDAEHEFFERELKGEKVILYSAKSLPPLSEKVKEILPGEFSRQNIALSIAIAKEFGIPQEAIAAGLENFAGIPGRAEIVQRSPFRVVVDYAHTPESLEAIYKTLKGDLKEDSKLICLLGSAGGGRDKWKRPAMGSVAAKYCNQIILTNEDPYDEDPPEILKEVKSGIKVHGFKDENILEILDRREAIKKALELAAPGDTIVSTGKGSESWIHQKNGEKISWSERGVFEEELKK